LAVGGPLDLDNTYRIANGNADAVPVVRQILKKKYSDSCYWEGECLVLRRVHELNDFALIMKRYLEENGQVVRLVSVHLNLKTNEETESISFFSKVGPSPHNARELFPPEEQEPEEVDAPPAAVDGVSTLTPASPSPAAASADQKSSMRPADGVATGEPRKASEDSFTRTKSVSFGTNNVI